MNTASLCPVCLRSKEDCRKEDEKLLKPFDNSKVKNMTYRYLLSAARYDKAFNYSQGLYNPINNQFYFHKVEQERPVDGFIKLPLCVWENNTRHLYHFLLQVTYYNIIRLPLPRSIKKKLMILFTNKIVCFMYSFPLTRETDRYNKSLYVNDDILYN